MSTLDNDHNESHDKKKQETDASAKDEEVTNAIADTHLSSNSNNCYHLHSHCSDPISSSFQNKALTCINSDSNDDLNTTFYSSPVRSHEVTREISSLTNVDKTDKNIDTMGISSLSTMISNEDGGDDSDLSSV
eukprot:15366855-Ditylum_brightwellii.AAC.1